MMYVDNPYAGRPYHCTSYEPRKSYYKYFRTYDPADRQTNRIRYIISPKYSSIKNAQDYPSSNFKRYQLENPYVNSNRYIKYDRYSDRLRRISISPRRKSDVYVESWNSKTRTSLQKPGVSPVNFGDYKRRYSIDGSSPSSSNSSHEFSKLGAPDGASYFQRQRAVFEMPQKWFDSEKSLQNSSVSNSRFFTERASKNPLLDSKPLYSVFSQPCTAKIRNSYISLQRNTFGRDMFTRSFHSPVNNDKSQLFENIKEISFEREKILVNGDVINDRYLLIRELGSGSFGKVYKAFDKSSDSYVAIKFMKRSAAFKAISDAELRVLKIVKQNKWQNSKNIVKLMDNFSYGGYTCMVFELLCINLFQLISRNNFQGLSLGIVKKFTECILNSLKFLHSNKIVHCDLKPENILIERPGHTNVKVIDFGSSCTEGKTIYGYIQSRFYRAPEVILGIDYGTPVDIWSLGCIVMELLTGTPLFPGNDEFDQLACILEVLGNPPMCLIKKSRRRSYFFTDTGKPLYIEEIKFGKKRTNRAIPGSLSIKILLSSINDDVSVEAVDFIERCLRWNPSERMTAVEALRHPWIRSLKEVRGPENGFVYRKLSDSSEAFSKHLECQTPNENKSNRRSNSTAARSVLD